MFLNPKSHVYEEKVTSIAKAEFDLNKAGFGWVTNNSGIHLQIQHEGVTVADYWPTTGTLRFRTKDTTIRRNIKKALV